MKSSRMRRCGVASETVGEAAFWAAGWGTVWDHRDGADEDAVRAFYGLTEEERLLGWLFVGRPPRGAAAEHTATRPTPGPRVTYH